MMFVRRVTAIDLAARPSERAMTDVSIMRSHEVRKRTGLGRTTIHNLVKSGRFPAPLELPGKRSGWLMQEVEDWILQMPRKGAERAAACANVKNASVAQAAAPVEPAVPVHRKGEPKRTAPAGTARNDAAQQQLPLIVDD